MRIRAVVLAAAAALGGISVAPAHATLVDPTGQIAAPAPEAGQKYLPFTAYVEDLAPTAGGVAYLALDRYKHRAATEGVVYASREDETGVKSDALAQAAVARVPNAHAGMFGGADRGFGIALILAAGVLMWLGVSRRRAD